MVEAYEFYKSLGYTLENADIIPDNAECFACQKSAISSPAYSCTRHDTKTCYLHKTCSGYPIFVHFHDKHPLRLEEDVIVGEDAVCHACNIPIIGSPTYTCLSRDVDTRCRNFYLHKSCAELPTQVNHHKHNAHPLSLLPRNSYNDDCSCDVCSRPVKTSYACRDCDFDVCVLCAFEQRVLHHDGHKEHPLTLMKKEAYYECDACYAEAKDSSYVCTICEFWIHKSCAFSPSVIPDPTYHHHPLTLVYSIPDIHRYFIRDCDICSQMIAINSWLYYCHKCTYFVHMKCSKSTVSMAIETEADEVDSEPDLVQFPLPSQESIFDLIVTQCGKFQVDITSEVVNSDPDIIRNHWSHENHPLQKLQFTISENDNDDSDSDRRALICNGCIQPITVSQPSFYACFQCGFFLHAFCADKLPPELAVGASPSHPNHSLLLRKGNIFYSLVNCDLCWRTTNGFYYDCQSCDFKIDIRCAFLPTRIKHTSHKHHSLVQRPSSSEDMCNVTKFFIFSGMMVYACETCSSFQICGICLFYPSRMEDRYDKIHPITLRNPPFFYEGVFYCEICEEQVNNQKMLYHCKESDHSFHCDCLGLSTNVKLGGTIHVKLVDKLHTLALVVKMGTRKIYKYNCSRCRNLFTIRVWYFFECDGCGYLLCFRCALLLEGTRDLINNIEPDGLLHN